MAIFNEYSSRIVTPYGFGNVSIANKPLRPGNNVVYIDTRGLQHSVNITDISYTFEVGNEGYVLGTKDCQVSGVGFIIPTTGDNLSSGANEAEFYCY